MDELAQTLELYHPDILAYARDPARWRKEHDAHYVIKAYNPVCGDKFEIRVDVDGIITDTSFFGYGCVVSKASTALLTEILVGVNLTEARRIIGENIRILTTTEESCTDDRLEPFRIARQFPGRIQCVLLSWEALLCHELFKHS